MSAMKQPCAGRAGSILLLFPPMLTGTISITISFIPPSTEDELRNVFRVRNVSGSGYRHAQTVGNNHSFDLMIDIKNKLKEGKGRGYERWAKSFNLKQTAEVLCFLKEHDIHDFDQIVSLSNGAAARLNELSGTIKNCERRMHDISNLRTQIINYVKTNAAATRK